MPGDNARLSTPTWIAHSWSGQFKAVGHARHLARRGVRQRPDMQSAHRCMAGRRFSQEVVPDAGRRRDAERAQRLHRPPAASAGSTHIAFGGGPAARTGTWSGRHRLSQPDLNGYMSVKVRTTSTGARESMNDQAPTTASANAMWSAPGADTCACAEGRQVLRSSGACARRLSGLRSCE